MSIKCFKVINQIEKILSRKIGFSLGLRSPVQWIQPHWAPSGGPRPGPTCATHSERRAEVWALLQLATLHPKAITDGMGWPQPRNQAAEGAQGISVFITGPLSEITALNPQVPSLLSRVHFWMCLKLQQFLRVFVNWSQMHKLHLRKSFIRWTWWNRGWPVKMKNLPPPLLLLPSYRLLVQ